MKSLFTKNSWKPRTKCDNYPYDLDIGERATRLRKAVGPRLTVSIIGADPFFVPLNNQFFFSFNAARKPYGPGFGGLYTKMGDLVTMPNTIKQV